MYHHLDGFLLLSTPNESRHLRRRFIWRLTALLAPLSLLVASLHPLEGYPPLLWSALIFLSIVVPVFVIDQAIGWIQLWRWDKQQHAVAGSETVSTVALDQTVQQPGSADGYPADVPLRADDEVLDFPLNTTQTEPEPSLEDYWAGVSRRQATASTGEERCHDDADHWQQVRADISRLLDPSTAALEQPSGMPSDDFLTADTEALDCRHLSADELNVLVSTLQMQKTRLRRLVIAQGAVLNKEREAQDRSRLLMRDAMRAMHDTRADQKQAERWARHERLERSRLEQSMHDQLVALQLARLELQDKNYRLTDDEPIHRQPMAS